MSKYYSYLRWRDSQFVRTCGGTIQFIGLVTVPFSDLDVEI
jgi:hypothetical protein|eukprot:COSAG06_NODE_881_length_11798_cov_119.503205_3_plen_41_part_00